MDLCKALFTHTAQQEGNEKGGRAKLACHASFQRVSESLSRAGGQRAVY